MQKDEALQRIVDKKTNLLSKMLKVGPKSLKLSKLDSMLSSSMSSRTIAMMQDRINNTRLNPLFKLTIEDYESMCGNNNILKMMSKVLDCNEKKLRKFCKYIDVFKENINSSPESIKKKMKSKVSLDKLPADLRLEIVKHFNILFPAEYILRDKISLNSVDWDMMSTNPRAIKLLKENMKKINWDNLSGNPYAIDMLKANPNKINFMHLSTNPHDEAIEMLKRDQSKINWDYLSGNSNPKAIQLLKANPDKINRFWLSKNTNPEAIKMMSEDIFLIDWWALSENPSAIELLKANPDRIIWSNLSGNPNSKAIEMLK